MNNRRSSSSGSIVVGPSQLYARWRRKPKARESSPLPPLGRRLRFWALICAALVSSGYFMWQRNRNAAMSTSTDITAPAAAHAPAKLETLPLAVPNSGSDYRELLARVQLQNELLYTDLQSFVCNEHIERFKGSLEGDKVRPIDTVTSKVSFENGLEHYSDIRQNSKERTALSAIPGAWSEGEFGTLLRQTKALLGTQPVLLKEKVNLDGTPAAEYVFEVGEADSPWSLVISGHEYRIPFETNVWVSTATGQMLKIQRSSAQLPAPSGISALKWSVSLEPVQLNEKTWLLPKTGMYEVDYANTNHKEWNLMNFSDYRRYSAQTILHF